MKRTLKFLHDAGHGWLSVHMHDIESLGLEDKVSAFSYRKGKRVYLEEDCDAGLFLIAARNAGWEIVVKDSYMERSWVRRLDSYKP